MLTLWKLALKAVYDLILRYAPNKVKRALPCCLPDSSPLSEGRGASPLPPKSPLFVFRLPSHSFWVVVVPERVSLKQTSFRSPYTPNAVYLQGFAAFTMSTDPHAGQQSGVVFVVLAWCWACDGQKPTLSLFPALVIAPCHSLEMTAVTTHDLNVVHVLVCIDHELIEVHVVGKAMLSDSLSHL